MTDVLRSMSTVLGRWRSKRQGRRHPVQSASALQPVSAVEAPTTSALFAWQRRCEHEQAIRDACQVAYLGGDTALCRVLDRYKMFVDTTDVGLSCHLMLDGFWEMWITEAICELVRPGMRVADIGANVGYYTLLMADLVGQTGRVHAFEPNPRLVALAEKSLAINGFVDRATVHQTALGDQDGGSTLLIVPPTMPMNGVTLPPGVDDPRGETVPVNRLDSREDWRSIELAKIDVDGAEELIWSGSQGLLDGTCLGTLLIEFNPHRYSDPIGFLDRMAASGFALHRVSFDAGVVATTKDYVMAHADPDDIMLVLKR